MNMRTLIRFVYMVNCNIIMLTINPQCGSEAITIGTRGFSLLTGFIGSSKTVNRCGNCGYSWKP